ncbi:MAG: DNA starvation/stationary phase protection protein [Candidatus Eremiobacteraeota bacterium]|nr:DNA starvation/stationary phase protection protein [Candidatus Eremiobacteraeota bacterium]
MSVTEAVSSRVPASLATPTDLEAEGRDRVVQLLNVLLADAFAPYVKTKNFHWHMVGSHYREYHLLLDEQADQIFAATDILAERVRMIGGTTIRSIGHIGRLQTIQDDDADARSARSMLQSLCEDNRQLTAELRRVHNACDDVRDLATASLLENFIDQSERRTWFLFETISDGDHSR